MKKKSILLTLALLISGLFVCTFTFSSCDKDTFCYVQVTVIDETNDTLVNNAYVKIDINGSSIWDEGYTNSKGVYNTHFAAPAIFNVNVKYIVNQESGEFRKGDTTIKLKEGETVTTTVYLKEQVYRQGQ